MRKTSELYFEIMNNTPKKIERERNLKAATSNSRIEILARHLHYLIKKNHHACTCRVPGSTDLVLFPAISEKNYKCTYSIVLYLEQIELLQGDLDSAEINND
jgi:hypothetical protein